VVKGAYTALSFFPLRVTPCPCLALAFNDPPGVRPPRLLSNAGDAFNVFQSFFGGGGFGGMGGDDDDDDTHGGPRVRMGGMGGGMGGLPGGLGSLFGGMVRVPSS
jgi:hypothetical protein